MKIYFYRHASFKPTDVAIYDCNGVVEFFDKNHINPDEYVISDKHGIEQSYNYDLTDDIYIIFPKIAKGSKGKGWLGVVLGIAAIFTAGATAGLLGLTLNGARMLGVGMLLSGAGTLIMGQQKLPSMDINTDSATKQNYQWNVGNLSTNRGVKGVTFGSNVVPEGELLAYRTYGTSSIEGATSQTKYYYGNSEIDKKYYDHAKLMAQDKRNVKNVREWINYSTRTSHTDAYANDDGVSWLEMLIGCGEGELDSITDIKVNDTPIENIDNAEYEVRLGSNSQSAFPQTNLDNQVGIMSVGQTMPQKLSGSDTPLVITTSHACDSVLIALQTNVLYNMDAQSGAKNRCYLKPKIGYRLSGSTGAYTYINTGIGEIDNDLPLKAESAFYFNVAIKFPTNGIYEISLQNCSAEKCVEKGLLDSLPTVLPDRLQCAISIDNIALYDNIEQTFPGTALIYLRLPASQALSGSMPKVTWKQSRNNAYVWNGSNYVAKPLNNLAWAIYDILAQVKKDGSNYHNEGEDVHNIDYDKFSDFADFCDDLDIKGNWFLNKLDTAWSTAMSVATSARAFIGTRNGRIAPFWDCATEMTQIFTVGNYESLSGAVNAKKDRARAIEATFNDEDDNYISKTIRVEVDDFAADADAVGVAYVGLTNVDAVYKTAHYQLRKNKYLCQTVKFTANLDALVCELNDVIGVQCDITKYGVGGRIFAVNGNQISLDAPVTLNGGNYALLVAHDNGTVERMEVVEHSGTYTTVTISGYTRAPKANEVYSFGVVNDEVKKYRVTSIVKTSDLKCEIEAVEYQPQVYVEGVAPDISYTNPNANISNIAVTYNPEGVDIAWHKDVNTAYVDVYVDGKYYGRFVEGATIPNVNSTQQIECVPVNNAGEEGTSVVRAISNSIPAPSQPPVPIVQALPMGVVAQFQIPQNQYITWIIIKEGDTELGRSIVAGDEVTLNLNLEGGTHHLTAYFLNSYGKTSTGRNFDATPFGIDSNMLSNGFLMKPQGSILRISPKGCTTASIRQTTDASGNPVYGVKDVSGYNHHGQAYGGVSVLDGGEGFAFDGANNSYVNLTSTKLIAALSANLEALTVTARIKTTSTASTGYILFIQRSSYSAAELTVTSGKGRVGGRVKNADSFKNCDTPNDVNDGNWHTLTGVLKYSEGIMEIYVDGVLANTGSLGSSGTFVAPTNAYIGSTSNGINGSVADVRIYPRALSATEVKSMYMLPDEAIFGQLNADLIGANVIKASNLVKTEALITEAAQISQAVVNNLNVSGNATFQAGLATKSNYVFISSSYSATLATINDYSTRASIVYTVGATEASKANVGDTVALKHGVTGVSDISYVYIIGKCLSKTSTTVTLQCQGYLNPNSMTQTINAANAVKTGVGTLGYTSIHGGNIATETIEAGSIKAGAITANKLNVAAGSLPTSPIIVLKAQAGYFASGSYVGDTSGMGRRFKLSGAFTSYSNANLGYMWRRSSMAASAIVLDANQTVSVSASFTFSIIYYITDWSAQPVFFDAKAADNANRVIIYATTARVVKVAVYNASGTATTITLGTCSNGAWRRLTVVCNAGTWTSYDSAYTSSTATETVSTTTAAHATLTATALAFGNLAASASASRGFIGYLGHIFVYNYALSKDQHFSLVKHGMTRELGTITADRIATDAIKSRTLSGGGNAAFTTNGMLINLAGNGYISSRQFYIDNAGNAVFKGKLSAASGSFSGTVTTNNLTATAGTIGGVKIENGTVSGLMISDMKAQVVETGKTSTSWYKKYSDGFIEQGGITNAFAVTATHGEEITFPKPFVSAPLVVTGAPKRGDNDQLYMAFMVGVTSNTKAYIFVGRSNNSGGANNIYWYACGY